jgi:integrase
VEGVRRQDPHQLVAVGRPDTGPLRRPAHRRLRLTGLRQGDLLRLSWTHIKAHHIEIRAHKTQRTVLIPLHAALRSLLATIPKRATTILTTTEKRPWKTGFGASWQAAIKRAGIDKHFHDLRGTAATNLYRADLSIREIAEIMGWSEAQVGALIDRYVKRDELMMDRIRRMDANASGPKPAKLPRKTVSKTNAAVTPQTVVE